MSIEAIVYTSNTGNTAQYAKLLAARTGLPAYSAQEAQEAWGFELGVAGDDVVDEGFIERAVVVEEVFRGFAEVGEGAQQAVEGGGGEWRGGLGAGDAQVRAEQEGGLGVGRWQGCGGHN